MKWIVTDENEMVQDISSAESNLSRGYNYPNCVVWEVPTNLDVKIGDHYDGTTLIQNEKMRAERTLLGVKHQLVDVGIRIDKAHDLGFTDVEQFFTNDKTSLETQKTTLEAVITK